MLGVARSVTVSAGVIRAAVVAGDVFSSCAVHLDSALAVAEPLLAGDHPLTIVSGDLGSGLGCGLGLDGRGVGVEAALALASTLLEGLQLGAVLGLERGVALVASQVVDLTGCGHGWCLLVGDVLARRDGVQSELLGLVRACRVVPRLGTTQSLPLDLSPDQGLIHLDGLARDRRVVVQGAHVRVLVLRHGESHVPGLVKAERTLGGTTCPQSEVAVENGLDGHHSLLI